MSRITVRERGEPSGGSGAFCVRLCDGRYFPLASSISADAEEAASTCNALCPATKTKVFRGDEAESARASDGTRYRDLASAFVFRERIVPDCSCNGRTSGGLAQMKIEADPTLEAGDITATPSGLMMFKGASRFPYKTADFTPVGSYAKISRDMRRTLAGIQIDTTATGLPAIIPVVAATEEPEPKKNRKGRTRQKAEIE